MVELLHKLSVWHKNQELHALVYVLVDVPDEISYYEAFSCASWDFNQASPISIEDQALYSFLLVVSDLSAMLVLAF